MGTSGAVALRVPSVKGQTRSDLAKQDAKGSTTPSSAEKDGPHGTKITWTEFMSGSILVECQLRFQVNFNWQVFEIIHEVRILSPFGNLLYEVCW